MELQLRQMWTLGSQIGDPSGFGRVFEAQAADGTVGVVKLIPKQPGADRELLFEDLAGVPNVVPIVDRGEAEDAWAIAMPRADRSLRAEVDATGGRLGVDAALPILIDVARGLAAIQGRVVHRDLKPENVLLLDGAWSLADFGIARYAEHSTAADTWKAALAAAYAAPERWRFQRATSAADVYSFGVMAFELLVGKRPFIGPGADQFREQHLHEDPPEVTGAPAALASLVADCMFKAPGSRPTSASLLTRLERASRPPSSGAARLQAANQAIQAANAREDASASAQMSEAERRHGLLDAASRSLRAISAQLRQAVTENAPSATAARSDFDDWSLTLGSAVIGMDPATLSDPASWRNWKPKLDVIAFAAIGVLIPGDRYGYTGRTHSLFYCDAQEEGVYRWYETAFMVNPVMPQRTERDPFALSPGELAGKALSPVLAESQVAWPFTPIDQGDEAEFIERWLDWFAHAAAGDLRHPSSMPERPPRGTWRQ